LRQRGGGAGSFNCPRCGQYLHKASHEGMPISRCDLCKGQLLEENKLPRAIAREESVFSDEVIRQAGLIADAIKSYSMPHRVRIQPGLRCPKCGNPMLANFYSLAYPIEVDRCLGCDVIWFDKNELEVLECLIEKTQNSQS
jgi:Zn-finger nucleic acid-binding protein